MIFDSGCAVFVHNHPSGEPAPSDEDVTMTRRLVATGELLGIRVLDHVILGDTRYFSFLDAGLLHVGSDPPPRPACHAAGAVLLSRPLYFGPLRESLS